MLRKFWNAVCETFSFERNDRKRSATEDPIADEEIRSPFKRRRLDISEPMTEHPLGKSLEGRRLQRYSSTSSRLKGPTGYMYSSEFVNDKENAVGAFQRSSEVCGSRDHPIVIEAADESVRIFKGASTRRQTNVATRTQWIPGVPTPNGARKKAPLVCLETDDEVQAVYEDPSTSRGAIHKFPISNRPTQGKKHKVFATPGKRHLGNVASPSTTGRDEDVQILEPTLNHASAGGRYSSKPYAPWSRPSRTGVLFGPSNGSSISSRRNSSSLGRPAIDICEKRHDKILYRQLIDSFKYSFSKPWSKRPSDRGNTVQEAAEKCRNIPVLTIDVDLDTRDVVEVNRAQESAPATLATKIADHGISAKHTFTRSNSVEELMRTSQYFQDVSLMKQKYDLKNIETREKMKEPQMVAKLYAEKNDQNHQTIEERLQKYCKLTEVPLKEVITKEEPELPELTPAMEAKIRAALVPQPRTELLVEAFSLRITRLDMQTLYGLNWLNDEVINLYMNLLIERGKEKGFLKVYAFNTFFYPRLLSGGHSALKRWTRKIELFTYDLVIVPIHLGVHWCMSAVDFRAKQINYYDSMGHPNNRCLKQLLQYLEDESQDKLKRPFDKTGWTVNNVTDIPQQMNGSDCGMFACMYAEYICRDADISFTQEDMPYFRYKMVYELLTSKLLPFK